MKRLLNYEFRKLIRQKSLYIFSAILVAMSILSLILNKVVADNFADLGELAGLDGAFFSASYSVLNAMVNSSFFMIAGIFIALFVCSDFSSQIVKNVYSRGYSKEQVFFAKYIASQVAVTAMFFVVLILSFLGGIVIFQDLGRIDGKFFLLVLGQWIACLGYGAFVFSFCMILRKTGSSIAIAIVGTTAITLLLSLVDALLQIDTSLTDFWLDGLVIQLADTTVGFDTIGICLGVSVGYIAIFTALGWLVDRKKEL